MSVTRAEHGVYRAVGGLAAGVRADQVIVGPMEEGLAWDGSKPASTGGLVLRNVVSWRGYTRFMGKNRTTSGMDFGVRVAAVVERGGELLLVRHKKPDRDAYWVLPGGRLEPGETIPECAVRELAEETGLAVSFSGVLYVDEFLREGRHTIDVVARMALEGDDDAVLGSDPEVAPEAEPTLTEVRWVSVDELREIELLPDPVKRRLLADAEAGWMPEEVYLGASRG